MINIIVLLGKSCSGKDSIKKELIKRGAKSLVTYTTRPPRDGEINGVAYNFMCNHTFLDLEENGYFAETTYYDTANMGRVYYGTSFNSLKCADNNTVVILNPDGLRSIKKIEGLDIVSFYITSKKSVLKKRLKARGDNRKEAKRRMKADKRDFKDIVYEVDYTIDNNGNKSIEELADIIQFIVNCRKDEKNNK